MPASRLLNHSSIVAREYRIPVAVNVGPATQIILTGQWLKVDAPRGVVKALGAAPETGKGKAGPAVMSSSLAHKSAQTLGRGHGVARDVAA